MNKEKKTKAVGRTGLHYFGYCIFLLLLPRQQKNAILPLGEFDEFEFRLKLYKNTNIPDDININICYKFS